MSWEIKTPQAAKVNARIAGLIGMIVLITGSFAHSVSLKLLDYNDAIKTSEYLLNSESLFRLGFVSGLMMQVVFIFYAIYLYKLLKNIDYFVASLMMIFVLTPVPIFLINQLNQFAVFILAAKHNVEQILFFLDLHKYGGYIVSIFYGLWLFPLGYLVFKSGFLPKIIGILLMIGCFGYLISFIQGFLFPNIQNTLWTNPVLIVTHVAELFLMLWLLVMGVNKGNWEKRKSEQN
ncbi:MAG: DUF4386 domain-containing protein [Chlorobi bacterium]|nr:DUF4386 domain-containing protein [Chlorobiota bacterium]